MRMHRYNSTPAPTKTSPQAATKTPSVVFASVHGHAQAAIVTLACAPAAAR
jgi:hypothetical protein